MKPYCTVPAILAITLFASVESAQATEEGVFLDPATGNYTVRYIGAVDSDAPGLLQEGT